MPPETLDYMIAGYAMGLGVLLVLVSSIWWRYRSLQADEAALERLETDIEQDATAQSHDTAQSSHA